MTESLIRSIDLKEVNTETRQFVGLVAPYDEVIDFGGSQEKYARGVFADAPLVQIYWNHDLKGQGGTPPIGQITEFRDTDHGLEVVGEFYETTRGDEVYTLVKRGALNGLSANFYPTQTRIEGDVTVYEKAELLEVSVVNRPAYPSAQISEVRAEPNNATNLTKEEVSEGTSNVNMSEATNYDDSEIRSEVDGLKRELAVVRENAGSNSKGLVSHFRSAGDLVHAAVNGDEAAKSEMRAYTGAALADSQARPGWIDQGLKLITANRIGYNLFRHAPLQSEGMSFSVPVLNSTTIQVGKQANEGDTLAYGKLTTATKTVTVDTYGGYVEWSKQVKDRSSIDYVNAAIDLLAIDYARKTNLAVVNAVTSDSGVNTGTAITLSSSTVAAWSQFVDEGVAAIGDNTGLLPEFMWVSRDVFYKIKGFADTTGRPLMEVNNDGSNTIGSANAVAVSGRFQGLNLVVDPGLAAKTAIIGNSVAATVFEAPGAPFNLADQNITNLTEQFALYGYLGVGVLNPKALFKVTVS